MNETNPHKAGVYDHGTTTSAPARRSTSRTVWIIVALIVLALLLAYFLS